MEVTNRHPQISSYVNNMGKYDKPVFEYLRTIPKGKVVTYGQVAAAVGNPKMARAVGNILHKNTDPDYYPCFRVVNSQGWLAESFGTPGGILDQKRRMEADGIKVITCLKRKDGQAYLSYKVDLEKYQWRE